MGSVLQAVLTGSSLNAARTLEPFQLTRALQFIACVEERVFYDQKDSCFQYALKFAKFHLESIFYDIYSWLGTVDFLTDTDLSPLAPEFQLT